MPHAAEETSEVVTCSGTIIASTYVLLADVLIRGRDNILIPSTRVSSLAVAVGRLVSVASLTSGWNNVHHNLFTIFRNCPSMWGEQVLVFEQYIQM